MFFIFHFFLRQRADSLVRFLIWSHVTPCFYCQPMITKSQFCHGGSVPDAGDLVKVIFASVIIYRFDLFISPHLHLVWYGCHLSKFREQTSGSCLHYCQTLTQQVDFIH